MNFKLKEIDHLNVKVPDLEKGVTFYKEVLGFEEKSRYEKDGLVFVFMTDGNIVYEVMEDKEANEGYFDHIAYVSTDINADYEFFKSVDSSMLMGEVGFVDFLFEKGVYYFFIKGAGGEKIEFCQRA